MSGLALVLAVAAAVACSCGQVCFKAHAARAGTESRDRRRIPLLAGLGFYGLYFLTLLGSYRLGASLSVAYPLTGLAYVITPALAWVWNRERFGRRVPIGVLLISLGGWLMLAGRE